MISVEMACWVSFFFQAEDGIRDGTVTGVQTCALPILLDLRGMQAGGSDFYCNSPCPEGFGFETIEMKLIRNLCEDGLLAGSEFDHEGHQQTLALNFLRGSLFQNFFEQHAFVRHVLIDYPQAITIDRQNKGIPNLAKRLKLAHRRRE